MKGPNLIAIAWRNLWRHARRTMITVVGIAFGVFLAVVFTGLGDGTYGKMIDDAAKAGGGHVSVQHREYEDLPTLTKTVVGIHGIRTAAEKQADVTHVVPRIMGATLVSTSSNSLGAFFFALDPAVESNETLMFLDSMSAGEMFKSVDDEGIILGVTLAENLGVGLGKKVVYTMTDKHGEIVTNLARLRGIVDTGIDSLDGGLCLLTLGPVRKLLGYAPDEVTQVAIFLVDSRDADDVVAALRPTAPTDAVVLPWNEAQPDLAAYIGMEKAGTMVMEGIIMVLLAAGIFNTLFVSVMERLREFGIMRAIGFSSRQLFSLVMWESFWLAIVGLAFAALITVGPYQWLHANGLDMSDLIDSSMEVQGVSIDPVLRVAIHGTNLFLIGLMVVIATMTSGLYPAWRAGRIPPADAIRLV